MRGLFTWQPICEIVNMSKLKSKMYIYFCCYLLQRRLKHQIHYLYIFNAFVYLLIICC